MKKVIFLAIAAFLFFVRPVQAGVCPPSNEEENYKRASVIFIGEIVSVNYDHLNPIVAMFVKEKCGSKTARFKVIESLKGLPKGLSEQYISVSSKDACNETGTYFVQGLRYLVYASQDQVAEGKLDDKLSTDNCKGTLVQR